MIVNTGKIITVSGLVVLIFLLGNAIQFSSIFKKWKTSSPPRRVGVILLFKNEKHALAEWLEHYDWQGVDAMLLIDNNSTDDWRPEVDSVLPKIKAHVTVVTEPLQHKQVGNLNKWGGPWIKDQRIDIVSALDADEFAFDIRGGDHKLGSTLVQFFEDKENSVGCLMGWSMFGSSGHVDQPPSIRKNFTWWRKTPPKNGHEKEWWVKHWALAEEVTHISVHYPPLKPDAQNRPRPRPSKMCPNLQLNHYQVQSWWFYANVKMKRGDSNFNYNTRDRGIFGASDWKEEENFLLRDLVLQHETLPV